MHKKWINAIVAVGKRHKGATPLLAVLPGIAAAVEWCGRLWHQAARRVMASALAVCMVFTLLPMNTFAAEGDIPTGSSSLTCHTEHDEDCGYAETIENGGCTHEHNEDCGYAEAISGTDCTHEHDADCGYTETVTVTSTCTHECALCEGEAAVVTPSETAQAAYDALDDEEKAAVGEECTTKLAALVNLSSMLPPVQPLSGAATPTVDGTNIYANGVPLLLVEGSPSTKTVIYIDKGTLGEKDEYDVLFYGGSMSSSKNGTNLSTYNIYGGSKDTELTGSTQITMIGGGISSLCGGGRAESSNANVSGDTNVTVNGGKIFFLCGGGRAESSNANVSGDTNVTVNGGEIFSLYGGGRAESSNANVSGSTNVTVNGGEVNNLCGGGRADNGATSTVEQDVIIQITNGMVNQVSGGGEADNGATSTVEQDVTIQISDTASVNSSIYGGGKAGNDATSTVEQDVTIEISGDASVRYYIYGGGQAGNGATSTVKQNVTIEISGTASVNNSIYGGGEAGNGATATVEQDVTIKISGNASVNNSIYGGGVVFFNSHSTGMGGIANVGGTATVGGSANITICDTATVMDSVYGGGEAQDGVTVTVTVDVIGPVTVTVGGGAKIGSSSSGIIINGNSVDNGVASFVINPALTGEDSCISVVLPAGYDVSGNPVIATGAVQSDLAKIRLIGDGAEDKEAYFETNCIRVKAAAPVPTVTNVTVTPGTAAVPKGMTEQFRATVTGENDPAQTVTWSIEGSHHTGTTIMDGLLSVAASETETSLTVKATSTVDQSKNGKAIITVTSQPVDTGAIDLAITAAETAKTGITVSNNSPSSVAGGTKFVTRAEMDALNAAIATAETAKTTATTTQQVQEAATELNKAVEAFKAAIKTGTYTSSSNDDNGSGSSGTPPTIVTPPENKPNLPITAEIDMTAKTDGKGNAQLDLPVNVVDTAINKALDAAKKNGIEGKGVAVQINVNTGTSPTGQTDGSITVNLPKVTQEQLISNKVEHFMLVIAQPDIALSLNLETIKSINTHAKSDVQLTATWLTDFSGLSAEARAAIGDRSVFRLTATYPGGNITSFGSGDVTLEFPYQLKPGEQAGSLYLVYIDEQGEPQFITDSSYDAQRSMLIGITDHFSLYGVGYKAPTVVFSDIQNHWAREDIEFAASRGLLNGTSKTTFSPDTGMTRGMFVTALGRLAGVDANSYKTGKFTDVKADACYAPYVNWAASVGIVNGTADTTFAPDINISREEMAVMMANYALACGYTVPMTREAVIFSDNDSIGAWAKDAVTAMQMAGIVNGKDAGRFDPQGPATRAEAAAMLHRYVELLIDPATAQGLDVNDSGSALMYESGRLVKSAFRTVGTYSYSFNGFGEAVLPVDDKKYLLHTV